MPFAVMLGAAENHVQINGRQLDFIRFLWESEQFIPSYLVHLVKVTTILFSQII